MHPTRVVTARYQRPDGSPCAGAVSFTPNAPVQLPGDDIVVPQAPLKATLDADGAFSVTLVCTDDEATNPDGWAYTVTEAIEGAPIRRYAIAVPAGEGPLDLADVAPLTTPPPQAAYVLVSQVGSPDGVASLGPDGKVPLSQLPSGSGVQSVNGKSGTEITLTAEDVGAAPAGHTHEGDPGQHTHPEYAPVDHNHSGVYAPVAHSHPEYSPVGHDHDGVYAPLEHDHDGVYSPVTHRHDGDYEPLGAASAAVDAHESDSNPHPQYALGSHDHSGVYEPSGAASAAVAAHEAENDPHPQYVHTEGGSTISITDLVTQALIVRLAAGDRAAAPDTFQVQWNAGTEQSPNWRTTTALNEYGELRVTASAANRVATRLKELFGQTADVLQVIDDMVRAIAGIHAGGVVYFRGLSLVKDDFTEIPAAPVIVLGAEDPVPGGLPAGTVILRRDA